LNRRKLVDGPVILRIMLAGRHKNRHVDYLVSHASFQGLEARTVPPLSIGRKIAIVFIGTFIVSSAALVELISSKVTDALERLAIASSAERYQRIYDTANLSAQIDPKILSDLRLYIPSDYALHLISRDGRVTSTGEPLTPDEVDAIRRMGNGDSTAFVSKHAVKFAKLKDGSILALSIPWAPYQSIPIQITLYTFIIALLTSVIFARAKGYTRALSAAELEMMNLTGDGTGLDMVTMPQPMREQVPTSNFFQRSGYERNPVAIRNNTVAKLLAVTDSRMDSNSNLPGAKDLAASF